MQLYSDDPDATADTPSLSHAEATTASRAERSTASASRDFCKASAAKAASAIFFSDSVEKQNEKNIKVRKVNPNIKRAKVKDSVLTIGSLLILRRAPVPTDHLALSCGEVGLGLVQGKVLLGEQSF